MSDNQSQELEKGAQVAESSAMSGRRVIILVGGFFLIGLAIALLIFGGPLASILSGEPSVDLPQIPTIATQSDFRESVQLLEVGDQAYDFTLMDLDNQQIALSDFRGRPLLINFWATWCAPCRLEMPEIQRAFENYQDQGLMVLAVNQQETAPMVRSFFNELGLTFTPLLDSEGDVGRAYGAVGLPSTFFVNSSGEVTAIHRGILTEGQIADYLALTLP